MNREESSHIESNIKSSVQLKMQVDILRQKLSDLVHLCNSTALKCDKLTVLNDLKLSVLSQEFQKLRYSQTAFTSLYDGALLPALSSSIHDTRSLSRRLRFQLAIQTFNMHRMDVGKDNKLYSKQPPRGIGKIGGLPLPHAGPVLYSCLPPEVLTSAIRFVASLTHTLSRVLGVPLPHPILLHSTSPMINNASHSTEEAEMRHAYWNQYHGDITSIPPKSDEKTKNETENQSFKTPTENLSRIFLSSDSDCTVVQAYSSATSTLGYPSDSSTSSWSVRGTFTKAASEAISRASKLILPSSSLSNNFLLLDNVLAAAASTASPACSDTLSYHQVGAAIRSRNHQMIASPLLKMDTHSIQQRLQYCTATFICESIDLDKKRSQEERKQQAAAFELKADADSEIFSIGLQLLQNDVVALCIHAGVPVASLWPAEAMLLNLQALWTYCCSQATAQGNEEKS